MSPCGREDNACAEAAEHGHGRIAQAVELARKQLGGEDVRAHAISFNPDYGSPTPVRCLNRSCVRGASAAAMSSRSPLRASGYEPHLRPEDITYKEGGPLPSGLRTREK